MFFLGNIQSSSQNLRPDRGHRQGSFRESGKRLGGLSSVNLASFQERKLARAVIGEVGRGKSDRMCGHVAREIRAKNAQPSH